MYFSPQDLIVEVPEPRSRKTKLIILKIKSILFKKP